MGYVVNSQEENQLPQDVRVTPQVCEKKELQEVLFISRHPASPVEEGIAAAMGLKLVRRNHTFRSQAWQEVYTLINYDLDSHPEIVFLVAPAHVVVELVAQGYYVVSFMNDPAARARGVFECIGACLMAIEEGELVMSEYDANGQPTGCNKLFELNPCKLRSMVKRV